MICLLRTAWGLALLAIACRTDHIVFPDTGPSAPVDQDGDGYTD